jgi:acetyl esterase/lipase
MFKAAVAILLLIIGSVAAKAQAPSQPELRSNLSYGPDPAQKVDVCLPPANQPGPHPAVLLIHGGYWVMGDKGAYTQLCQGAAAEGIVAATIGYRLADGGEHNRWPAQLVDAQLAVRWLRSHAREFGADPARICVLGDSAGAQLAVFLAALDHTVPGDYAGQLSGVSSKIACAVDNFGPIDLSDDTYWPPDQKLFGSADRNQVKDQERAASPIFVVGPGTAPLIIAHGRADKAVNVNQSIELADRLKAQHVPVRLMLLDGGHEFEGLSGEQMGKIFQQELDFIKGAKPRS